ncbi:MAG: CBS domain-containing protein [Candidatus Binatia bacterium]
MAESVPEVEEYLQGEERKPRALDDRVLREPISVLKPAAPVCVERGSMVSEAVRQMQEHRIGCVLVTDGGRLAGIFTERDVLRDLVGKRLDPEVTPIDELMTPDPETLSLSAGIMFALNKMSLGGFRHVPLVDESHHPVGIVSVKDIVDYIVDFFPEVLNVPPEPGLDVARAREGA